MIKIKNVTVNVSYDVLNSIYKECDKYDNDETGGRLIGFYKKNKKNLEINVAGEIGPGPNARRSRTSFFQDGSFQQEIFRTLEEKRPELEHLGNWHTHHVNGYPTLSSGDLETYTKIVNSEMHNTDFLYIMLVTSKNNDSNDVPYTIKHFIFFRNSDSFVEIPMSNIKVINEPSIWVGEKNEISRSKESLSATQATEEEKLIRFYDHINIAKLFPSIKPYYSKQHECIYWKGKLPILTNALVDVIILENSSDKMLGYAIGIIKADFINEDFVAKYKVISFESVTQALVSLERDLNSNFH